MYNKLLSNMFINEEQDKGEDFLTNVCINFGKRISK